MNISFVLNGVTFTNANGLSRQQVIRWSNAGDPVRLERENGNPHDENAIRVIALKHGAMIGYVPRELAAVFVSERRFPAPGTIEDVFGGNGDHASLGCRIKAEFAE